MARKGYDVSRGLDGQFFVSPRGLGGEVAYAGMPRAWCKEAAEMLNRMETAYPHGGIIIRHTMLGVEVVYDHVDVDAQERIVIDHHTQLPAMPKLLSR